MGQASGAKQKYERWNASLGRDGSHSRTDIARGEAGKAASTLFQGRARGYTDRPIFERTGGIGALYLHEEHVAPNALGQAGQASQARPARSQVDAKGRVGDRPQFLVAPQASPAPRPPFPVKQPF